MKTKIKNYEFEGRLDLTEYVIPDGVKKIGWGAFYACRNLKSITIPDGVTVIDKFAFCACNNLKSVTIPKGCQYDKRAFGKGVEVIIR